VKHLFDDREVPVQYVAQSIRRLSGQQLPDCSSVPSSHLGNDGAVSKIALSRDVHGTNELVRHARHRRNDDEPPILNERVDYSGNLPETLRVGEARSPELVNDA